MNFAVKLVPILDDKIKQLHNVMGYSDSELKFLNDGIQRVIESRRVLKWS